MGCKVGKKEEIAKNKLMVVKLPLIPDWKMI